MVMTPPRSNNGRRPNRSDAQPTTGRSARAAIENAPMLRPTPVTSAPSGPAANRVATGSTVPPAVKNARAAAQTARNAGVRSRRRRHRSVLGGRHAPAHPVVRIIASRRRSAAAYGSRRCSATSVDDGLVQRRELGTTEPVGQAVGEHGPHLRRGPHPAGGARHAVPVRRTMPVQRHEELRHPDTCRGRRDQDLGAFRPRAIGLRPPDRRGEHRAELGGRPQRARLVALVHDHEVGDLEQTGLDGLDLVAHLGRLQHDRRVGRGRDLDLALARPDRLDEDEVEARRVQHGRCRGRRRREATGMAARRHRSDEDVAVAGVRLHAHAIAQQGATGDRRRRVHGHDGHRSASGADLGQERGDERRLVRPPVDR